MAPRRRRRIAVATSFVVAAATLTILVAPSAAQGQVTGSDALHSRVRTELAVFTGWLNANGAKGYVGEVGWPNDTDATQWNSVAQAWYADAAAANLMVSNWSAGEWWGSSYKLSSYVWGTYGGPLAVPRSAASVIEAQASADRKSVNMNGADFGPIGTGLSATSTLSNTNPGAYGSAYQYDSQQSFNYLASRGIKTVRLAFRWERIQPALNAPLNATELGRLVSAVGRARAAGLTVILNPQNYGAYWMSDGTQGVRRAIGSAEVPQSAFADLWTRLSQQFKTDPGVAGYGLMNEPVGMPGGAATWEQASQGAVTAIRSTGDTKAVMVPGYQWSGVSNWSTTHPQAWITDPAANFRYEAHHYFDRDNSGSYPYSYTQEVADAQSRGYTASTTPTTAPPVTTTTTVPATTTTTVNPVTTTTTVAPVTTTTLAPVTTTTVVAGGDTTAPSTPAGLSANGARRKVILTWSGSTDAGGSGLAGYEVWRAMSAAGPFVRIATPATASYSDSAVASRLSYWYMVKAYDKAGNRSAQSSVVSAIPN